MACDSSQETGIYVPVEQLGSGADDGKFLRGDSTWADPAVEFSPDEFIDLLVYAFQRIRFLEHALQVAHEDKDLARPQSYDLVQERVEIWT